jgi:hypothetical protein
VPDVTVNATAFGVNLGAGATYTLSLRLLARADFRCRNHMYGTASDPQQFLTVDDVPTVRRFIGGLPIRVGE